MNLFMSSAIKSNSHKQYQVIGWKYSADTFRDSINNQIFLYCMKLSQEEKVFFSEIMFQAQGRQKQGIAQLNEDELYRLRKLYAQKIAFEAVNSHIQPPAQNVPIQTHRPTIPGILSTVCCCLYPEQNRENFDVKSSEFINRTFRVFLFWKNDFITHQMEPQLYGPLWISVTYIIILGLAANLNNYFILPQNYQFNTQIMIYAIGLTVIFQLATPLIYTAVIQCLGGSIPSNQSFMLTGYSLMIYMIPTILCLVPSLYWHAMMLAIGGFFRGIFLFRNYAVRLDSKTYIMFLVVNIVEALYCFLVLKVMFPKDNGYEFQKGTEKVFHDQIMMRRFHDSSELNNNGFF